MVSPISTLCTIFQPVFQICVYWLAMILSRDHGFNFLLTSSSTATTTVLLAPVVVPRLISRRSCSTNLQALKSTKPSQWFISLTTIVVSVSVSAYLLAIWRICSRVRCCASSAAFADGFPLDDVRILRLTNFTLSIAFFHYPIFFGATLTVLSPFNLQQIRFWRIAFS